MAIHYQNNLDRAFHALGDGTRREMISMLASRGALSAGELRAPFSAAQPTISKHLKVLESAGLVRREVNGRVHHFHLVADSMKQAEDWISRHRTFWEGALQNLECFVTEAQPELQSMDRKDEVTE
ncbi:metalloregulator ArsR/SmtB family transcription factor [uncultured Roseibium sp.]|uniref:ArsR/SmtB family transcription factor n=1 Tax=uncultured Roseibium sp. TaxID=1936171 RepID=UPI00262B8CF7|nr:metalloregulator ArsR/SmtB family transcription factor [uncultured Roseibium sp.]